MSRRDATTAATLSQVWRPARYVNNLVSHWGKEQDEASLVVADALIEQGYSKVGADLSRFAKRMREWKKLVPFYGFHQSRTGPQPPEWKQWTAIVERVDQALREIASKPSGSREWHQKRPHQAMIVFRRSYGGDVMVRGPYPITPRDLEDITTIRRWFVRAGFTPLGRLYKTGAGGNYRRQGVNVVLRPASSFYRSWASITIEPGQVRARARAREAYDIAQMLERYNFLRPKQYGRMLQRHGSTVESVSYELRRNPDAFAARFNFRRKT